MTTASKKVTKSKFKPVYIGLLIVVFLVAGYSYLVLTRSVSAIRPEKLTPGISIPPNLSVSWPKATGTAVGVEGYGLLDSSDGQTVTPTASIAKLIVALAVLSKYPLSIGQSGPTVTLTQADVNDYNDYVAQDGSVIKVQAGETLTEYQALQAMLLPSANNIADTLASWAFGSISNYALFANKMVKTLGLNNTHIADASGFSPETTSTADDLIILGEKVLGSPVIAQIIDQKTANLPVAGLVNNVDFYLGEYSLIGIKTGNTDQAGGCFLAAARYSLANQQSMTVISVVLNAPTLQQALNDSVVLLQSIKQQIIVKTIPAGTVVAKYVTPWGSTLNAVTQNSLSAAYLPGMKLSSSSYLTPIKTPILEGTPVGVFALAGQTFTTKLISQNTVTAPNIGWKLLHPKFFLN